MRVQAGKEIAAPDREQDEEGREVAERAETWQEHEQRRDKRADYDRVPHHARIAAALRPLKRTGSGSRAT